MIFLLDGMFDYRSLLSHYCREADNIICKVRVKLLLCHVPLSAIMLECLTQQA